MQLSWQMLSSSSSSSPPLSVFSHLFGSAALFPTFFLPSSFRLSAPTDVNAPAALRSLFLFFILFFLPPLSLSLYHLFLFLNNYVQASALVGCTQQVSLPLSQQQPHTWPIRAALYAEGFLIVLSGSEGPV